MPFWPFKRKEPEALTPAEIRDRLIAAAASGNRQKLLAACQQYKAQVAANVDLMCKAEGMKTDEASLQNYIQCLGAVAESLAQECGSPELWNRLCGTPDSNPLLKWEKWFAELPQRVERFEHPALIEEARQFIAEAQRLQGHAARQNEAFLNGRLGELLYHSGNVAGSLEPWLAALKVCREMNDVEGQKIYLNNLLEAHRYLGKIDEAIRFGEEATSLATKYGLDCEAIRKQVQLMRQGESLCRVVFADNNGKEFELEEFVPKSEGRYQFLFRRNRLSLQMTTALVRQGNELASSGRHADAMEKYQAAMEVDPHDPDPVYQSGMCLMEMGLYAKAREAYDEVERLAPGWFRCRFDRWLAENLEMDELSDTEFRLVRLLEDGGLPPDQAKPLALKAVADYPQFAPFYLFLGDIHRDLGDKANAIAHYRKGLELVSEPDLETRLLCALAGTLPVESPERQELVKRTVNLKGSLVAKAITAFIPVK